MSRAGEQTLAAFGARSYLPGETATLRIGAAAASSLTLEVFLVGGESAPASTATGHDALLAGAAVTAPATVRRPAGGAAWVVRIPLGDWPSGVYVARLTGDGVRYYAPFVLSPPRLGDAPVLVVEPTNTWQAYNFESGDSWYRDPAVHVVDLGRPYLGNGLPPHFADYDLGFLRWYWRSGFAADFVTDDRLESVSSLATLRRYRLIVFPGHEEYVTAHVYDLIARYRDAGGNLAFLSADSFFYAVSRSGNAILGRTRWRDLGRPEAALLGAQYAGWNERFYRNRAYRVVDTGAAPWLFAGTDLHDGSLFGHYGIEIDERTASSPPGTHVLAEIPNEFGPGMPAEMTFYRRGSASVFDAGVINFGATADWPGISVLVANLWRHLGGGGELSGQIPSAPAR